MHVKVDYPKASVEKQILQLSRREAKQDSSLQPEHKIPQASIFAARAEALNLHMSDAVEEYIVQLTAATRAPGKYSEELARAVAFGVSPPRYL